MDTLHWIGVHQKATNEPIPHQLGAVLHELETLIEEEDGAIGLGCDRSAFKATMARLRSLACTCSTEMPLPAGEP